MRLPRALRSVSALIRLVPFRNAYVVRGLLVWGVLRLALASGGVVDPEVATEVALLGAVALAVFLDARRRSEDLFLGNLGIPAWTTGALALPAALVLEMFVS